MKQVILLLSTIILILTVGCDKETKRELISSTKVQQVTSCNNGPAGVCYACGFDHRGRYSCGFGLHLQCPGNETVLTQLDEYEITYQKSGGEVYKERKQNSQIVQRLTPCR